jgi:uncharacterized membrane protein YeaQ/YmgE (transglycosylase-associated protein family)
MIDLLLMIIGGAIIGFVGKMVARGSIRIPTWLTVACGIGGVLIGNFFYTMFFNDNTAGFDWWRHTWQVVVAAVLVTFAAGYRSRPKVNA